MQDHEKQSVIDLIRECADEGIFLSKVSINIHDIGTERTSEITVEIEKVGDSPKKVGG